MFVKKSPPLLLTVAGGVVLLAVSGCYAPYYVGGGVGYQSPYVGTVVAYQPSWYDYYYYPSIGVYYNYRSGYYYHHDHGRWRHVRRLPRHIRIDQHDRVHLRMRGDRPYTKYAEHQRIYRKNGNYYRGDSAKRTQRQYKRNEGSGKGSGGEVRSRERHTTRKDSAMQRNRGSGQHRNIDSARYERHQQRGSNLDRNSGWHLQE